jgi:peptidoglycan/xylan/chitin deacetylase (PgdA/CDA1 family)
MSLAGVVAAVREPGTASIRWRARRNPATLAERQVELARRAGLTDAYLVLSFDCDTEEDARVVPDVHARLDGLGVEPTYAVPGELLRRTPDVYLELATAGVKFLNHGGKEHTYFDDHLGRYASCFFYDRMPPELVREDIVRGHQVVQEVLGIEATGWRTPHFGTYGRPGQLRFLHSALSDLGYRFSSSTTPIVGLRWGPVVDRYGLPELPVTGAPASPLQILDSWGYFAAPERNREPGDYLREAKALADAVSAAGVGIINVYADPSHIHDRSEFFEAVSMWRDIATPTSYEDLLERLGR